MISDTFYCPECGELWDEELCDQCGYAAPEFIKNRPPRKDSDGHQKKMLEKNKVKRVPREGKGELDV
jgi:hypothetical protein